MADVTKPYALVFLWAVFAAAAVGVGFAAAGLVTSPFDQQVAGAGVPVGPGSGAQVANSGSASASGSPTTSPSPGASSRSGSASSGRSGTPRSGSPSASSTGRGGGAHPATSQPRGITTRGGWVQGRCSGGLVTLSASPAVGWWLHDRSLGANSTGRVRFEETGGTGEVRVSATCVAGTPRFSVTEEQSGGGGGDGGGGGGDDGGGSGGSGGGGGKGKG